MNVSQLYSWVTHSQKLVKDSTARGLVLLQPGGESEGMRSPYPVRSIKLEQSVMRIFFLGVELTQSGVYWDEGKRAVLLENKRQPSATAFRIRDSNLTHHFLDTPLNLTYR